MINAPPGIFMRLMPNPAGDDTMTTGQMIDAINMKIPEDSPLSIFSIVFAAVVEVTFQVQRGKDVTYFSVRMNQQLIEACRDAVDFFKGEGNEILSRIAAIR